MGILLATLLAWILSGNANPQARLYPETMIVTEVNFENDIIFLECSNGNQFSINSDGNEDLVEGDIVSCIMYDNGTPLVIDDEILSVKYSGYVELFDSIDYEGR